MLSVQLSTDGFGSPQNFLGGLKIYPAMFEIPGVVPEPIFRQLEEAEPHWRE